jgi:cobalt-zinc-cadmium efflux system outer membrane protein
MGDNILRGVQRNLIALAALAVTACIHVDPRPIDPVVTGRGLESRTLADPDMQAFVAAHSTAKLPITRWDIDTLTLAAFYFHPALDVARAQAAVARAAIETAGERPNPTLNVPIENHGGPQPWVIVPNLDFTIELGNKRALRTQQATNAARVAEIGIAQEAWQIRSAIRAQLATLDAAQLALEALERERIVQQDLIEALQKRVEVGEGSRLELTTARISARQVNLLRRDRTAQVVQARARLAASLGIPVEGLGNAELRFDRQLPDMPADLREKALRARPDVLMSLADYAATESALRLELARQYPDLHIAPGFGWDAGVRRWDLGLSSMLPILSHNRGPIDEAVARRSLSEANFLALQARVIGGLDEASAMYREALQKVSDAAAAFDLQKEQVDTAQKLFNAGESDRVALRTAELELESARLAHADAIAQAEAALGALEDAVEQPLSGAGVPADITTTAPRGSR